MSHLKFGQETMIGIPEHLVKELLEAIDGVLAQRSTSDCRGVSTQVKEFFEAHKRLRDVKHDIEEKAVVLHEGQQTQREKDSTQETPTP